MGEDDVATVRTIKAYREVMASLIEQYQGRVVDSPGDNLLAEFGSVVDAVQCAVEIQQSLKAKNAELPKNRQMEFRIGINVGDVIEEGGGIYGDGVNVAARIEGLAEGGGICISNIVFDQVKRKLKLGYRYMGEHSVKNIDEPVRVYQVLPESDAAEKVDIAEAPKKRPQRWAALVAVAVVILVVAALSVWQHTLRSPQEEPASLEKMAFPLPDKPSIAVLPFDNMSDDAEQEYLADGITENITTALSNIPEMFVIARNSTFTYKGKPVKVQQVSEELGVRYVLEGSVQRAGDRMRVTAQLVDATTGRHLWAGRYDRDIKDLFALQDEITQKIAIELQVELVQGEGARKPGSTDSLEAWEYGVKGTSLFQRFTKENNAKARALFERAIERDPDYAFAWTMLAWTHWADVDFGFSETPAESFKRAVELAEKSLALDDDQPGVHALLGAIHLLRREYEEAIAEGQRSIALGPNDATSHILLAQTMYLAGRFEEAITLAEKATRLAPLYPAWYLGILAQSYMMAGRYEEALAAFNQLLDRSRKGDIPPIWAHLGLTRSYMELGREREARVHAAEVLKIDPAFSLEFWRKNAPFKDPAHLERVLEPMRKAGLPDKPPLSLPEEPSIAVLPFDNMSGDPEQEYFSDGITEEIITSLSKVPNIFVIARNSTFIYKGKPVKVQQVSEELGVRYVLEGSIRKSDERVRVTAQLIDATTGRHVWADRYDRDLKDIFALQDEITLRIVQSLQVKLTRGEEARIRTKGGTDSLEAYLKYLQAKEHFNRFTKDDQVVAKQLAQEAIDLDPNFAWAYYTLGWILLNDASYGWSNTPDEDMERVRDLAQQAEALNSDSASTYALLSGIHLREFEFEEAIALREKAVALRPNKPFYNALLASGLTFGGRVEEGIEYFEKALRLDPFPRYWILHFLGVSHNITGKHEAAIEAFRRVIQRNPDFWLSHVGLVVTYSLLNRQEDARAAAKEVLRIYPGFSIMEWARGREPWYKHYPAYYRRLLDALRASNLE